MKYTKEDVKLVAEAIMNDEPDVKEKKQKGKPKANEET